MATTVTYDELVAQTLAMCAAVSNSPQGRLQLREAYYGKYGFPLLARQELGNAFDKPGAVHGVDLPDLGYGNSEIAFLKWEIKRGVLNPMDDASMPAGSPWWRDVNLRFIYYSELAGLMFENNVSEPEAPVATLNWLNYLHSPSAKTWYCAHNTSILGGFERYKAQAAQEESVEQVFLNITLYRLMFAQALVEDATMFGELGAIMADPRGFAVALITHLPDFYPLNYPLHGLNDLRIIEGWELNLQGLGIRILDHDIILPHLTALYQACAHWDSAPFINGYVKDGKPVYPQ